MNDISISDQMRSIVEKMDTELYHAETFPYHLNFLHGHPLEIVQVLQERLSSPDHKDLRFPLIALFRDFKITKGKKTEADIYGDTSLNLIIAMQTVAAYRADQRETLVFKPILYPIYNELLKQIKLSGFYSVNYAGIEHDQTDRYYWGRSGLYGNTGNTFNDYLDAIEIENLRLKIKNNHCKPFKSI